MKEIKHNIDLGKRNDQNIQNMPWDLFKQKLRFKCEYYNINFKEVAVRLGGSGWVSQPRRIRVVPLRTTKLLLKPHQ